MTVELTAESDAARLGIFDSVRENYVKRVAHDRRATNALVLVYHGSRHPSAHGAYTQAPPHRPTYHLCSHFQDISCNDLAFSFHAPSLPITVERNVGSGYIVLRPS
jgi:hypothetical protein